MPRGIDYNPCPWFLRVYFHRVDTVIWFLDCEYQNDYLTISIECDLGKEDVREETGTSCSQSLLTLTKKLELYISNQISLS